MDQMYTTLEGQGAEFTRLNCVQSNLHVSCYVRPYHITKHKKSRQDRIHSGTVILL